MSAANRTILIAGISTSQAVLTETVRALAHQEKAKASLKESPAALIDGKELINLIWEYFNAACKC